MFDEGSNFQEPAEHPGTLGMTGRTVAGVKHVIGKALKYGIIAGVAGAVIFAIAPATVGAVLASFSGGALGGTAFGMSMGAAATGAIYLGAAGAAIGGLLGLTSVSDAVETANEEKIFAYNRRETRQTQQAMMQERLQEQQLASAQQAKTMGINPNIGFGRAPGGPQMGTERHV